MWGSCATEKRNRNRKYFVYDMHHHIADSQMNSLYRREAFREARDRSPMSRLPGPPSPGALPNWLQQHHIVQLQRTVDGRRSRDESRLGTSDYYSTHNDFAKVAMDYNCTPTSGNSRYHIPNAGNPQTPITVPRTPGPMRYENPSCYTGTPGYAGYSPDYSSYTPGGYERRPSRGAKLVEKQEIVHSRCASPTSEWGDLLQRVRRFWLTDEPLGRKFHTEYIARIANEGVRNPPNDICVFRCFSV